ncbi:DUF3397 family protein [Sporosarcina sp. A2]|uniref:DUF3397 family protein n=1 Tax=Sporosarcina sp. A2 TaxID=3393449 RepID=UPI003D7BB10B
MKELLQFLLALIILVPYVLTIVIFMSAKISGRSSVKSFRIAADSTVPFLFLAVTLLLRMTFGTQSSIMLVVAVLLTGIGFAVLERLRSKEFRVQFMLRNMWRVLFVILSLLYITLLIGGLVKTVVEFIVK